MALVRDFAADRDKQVRRRKDGQGKHGDGDDRHILFGATGSGSTEYRHRSLIRFAHNWTGVKRVVKAEIVIRVDDDSSHYSLGSKPRVRARRLSEAFSDGSNGESVWTSGEYEWPSTVGAAASEAAFPLSPTTGLPVDAAFVFIDVTSLIKYITPTSVAMPDGTMGEGTTGKHTNYGWALLAVDEEANSQRGIAHARNATASGNRPFLRLTYDPVNQPPTAPTLTGPAIAGAVSLGDSFEGTHHDPELDPMAARNIEVWLKDQTGDAGKKAVWTLDPSLQIASSGETQSGAFSVPLSLATGSLKLQTDYEWRAQTKDPAGLWGPFSAVRALRLTSSAPTVVATAYTTVADMASPLFGGTYTDPDGDRMALFNIEMQAVSGHTDADFADPTEFVWTTGETTPTAEEVSRATIARHYAGRPLGVGFYTYRVRAQDDSGVWSPWSYDDFQLTAPFDPEPGNAVMTTQVGRIAPVRIALYSVFTDHPADTVRATGRGIGALIGYIDDPMDLGASAYLNGGGEVYWSLPALHPYCPEIEPHRTHYAVEQYVGDRYAVKFAGIVTDFDADPETATFYGTDYLGLLQTAVDERYNPDKPDIAADGNGGGGSRYPDKTIDFIIKDQLRYHKALSNSPVGFITLGSITALAERATIYSTYSEALPFISGLIDSHKQGTGRECRFYARPTSNTYQNWEWALIDNWGKDRPNIRLEYGGLLSDFEVVALGDFGTRVLGVGQKRGEVKVYRAQGPKAPVTGLPEADWGRRSQTRFYADIIDQADLQRRVNEDAMQLAKVGKRMALGLRADMLQPFDGWDLGDSIAVDIERGVVDSSQYGSGGFWTIYGVEWRYFGDGHTELTLTILPKKTDTPPDPDLIPSNNPGVPNEWQVGYGVPSVYGDPPSPTPDPPALLSKSLAAPEDVWRYRTGFTAPAAGQLKVNPGNTQALISKSADSGFPRAAELAELVIGSLIRIRSQGTLDRVGRVTNVADAGNHVALTYTPLLAVGALPTNNAQVLVNARSIGTFSFAPPSAETVIAQNYMDLNTGCVYELDESTGVYTEVFCPETGGGTTPLPPDTVPPPKPVIKSTSSSSATQDDGTSITSILAVVGYSAAPGITDLDHYAMESTRYRRTDDPTQPDWALATQWVTAAADDSGTLDTNVTQPSVHSATEYFLRVYAFDSSGNRSVVSDPVAITTATDVVGPPRPSGIVAEGGMQAIGVRWDPVEVEDLAYAEVQWRVKTPPGTWESLRIAGTLVVIVGLTNDVAYEVRVRSVDTSGNTLKDDGTSVKVIEDAEAGWVLGPDATPSALPGNSLVWDSAIIEDVFAGMLSADWLVAGTLTVGAEADGQVAAITVVDPSGNLLGRWSTEGIEVLDPANADYRLLIDESSLRIYNAAVGTDPIVSLTPLGIDAASITFGSARGGHNLIQNSSFELGAFAASAVTNQTWDVAADWNASRQGADTNVTTGASALTMTAI